MMADAGYWHQQQMERVISRGMQVLIPPDGGKRPGMRPGWDEGSTRSCAASYRQSAAVSSTENAKCPSSRCSLIPSATAGSIASDDAAGRGALRVAMPFSGKH